MKIKARRAFTARHEDGKLVSVAHGGVVELPDDEANRLIEDGLAEKYTLISPSGSVTITENGTVDVFNYAEAVVNVESGGGSDGVAPAVLRAIMTPVYGHDYDTRPEGVLTAEQLAGITYVKQQFFDNVELDTVELPETVTELESGAFAGAYFNKLIFRSETPPQLGANCLGEFSINDGIYVPAGSVEAYKTAFDKYHEDDTSYPSYAPMVKPIEE